MTEIPEHLLKRSRERRSAIGGGDDAGSGDAAPAASTPATTASATPAAAAPSGPPQRSAAPVPAAPEPPKPDIPVVAAYKARRKIPFWAMTALTLLPVWAFMYARAVTTQPAEAAGPLAEGAAVYGGCASCHGGSGEGRQRPGVPVHRGRGPQDVPEHRRSAPVRLLGFAAYNSKASRSTATPTARAERTSPVPAA